MADQAASNYLSIGTTFDPCYLSLDSTFKNVKNQTWILPNKKAVPFFVTQISLL